MRRTNLIAAINTIRTLQKNKNNTMTAAKRRNSTQKKDL